MALDIYSEYVNNYEAASELIKENSNTKQAFRDFLKVGMIGVSSKQSAKQPQRLLVWREKAFRNNV